MRLIWATRGRTWGFRFLRDGGLEDPLPAYESAFAGAAAGSTAFRRDGDVVAVRFPDPLGRRDAAGRPISHELVLFAPLSDGVTSVDDAVDQVWPQLADEYERAWDSDRS